MTKKKAKLQKETTSEISEDFPSRKDKKRRWFYAAGCIGTAAVMVTTSYLLMLPAITMTSDPICGMEEHIHDDSCYAVVSLANDSSEETADGERALICGIDEHVHTDACYGADTQTDQPDDTNNEVELLMQDDTDTMQIVGASDEKLILTTDGDDTTKTIESMTLSYKCPDADPEMTDFVTVDDSVTLHADDSLSLSIDYENVHIQDLQAHSYKMYYPLPDWMKQADGSKTADLLEGAEKVGLVTIEDDYLVATFDSTWLDAQASTASLLQGNLAMQASLDVDYVKNSDLTIGNLTIHVDYEAGKWESTYGTLNIEKSNATYIEQDSGYDLLQYTLTVSTGGTSMTDVKVLDAFQNPSPISDYVVGYVGMGAQALTLSGSNSSIPYETSNLSSYTAGTIAYADGTMTWAIGNMEANETRTLTYQVRLKKEITGLMRNNALVFNNIATLYSGDIRRDSDSNTFQAKASILNYKNQISYVPDEDGMGGTATYVVRICAQTNSYVVDNVIVYDFIGDRNTSTATPHDVTVDPDSFVLYAGNLTSESEVQNAKTYTKLTSKEVTLRQENGKYIDFQCNAGSFRSGESKTLLYKMHINDSYYLDNNGEFKLTNVSTLHNVASDGNTVITPNQNFTSRYCCESTINYSVWEKKYNGIVQSKNKTITMDGNVYDENGNLSDETSFSVKRNDYMYRVFINQDGLLDVRAVDLKDTLSQYMQYTGYLRVDEYDTLEDETLTENSSDPGDLSETILQTAWIKIDSKTNFSLNLSQLGLDGKHAYVLTYYTKIVYDGDDLVISVNNAFNMSGSVYGSGNARYVLNGVSAKVTLQASTSASCSASKSDWYYERPLVGDTSEWSQGAIYWTLKIAGTDIPAGTVLKDVVQGTYHKLVEGQSVVGAYIAAESATFSDNVDLDPTYTKLSELQDDASVTALSSSNYTVSWDLDNQSVSITFPHDVTIPEDKSIYLIVKTEVVTKPATGSVLTYQNSLLMQQPGKSFQSTGDPAQEVISGQKTCTKYQNDKAFIFDGSVCWNLDDPTTEHFTGNRQYKNYKNTENTAWRLEEPGTYVEYGMDTCIAGRLSGDVTFSDTLPEGMEPAFLRNGWFVNAVGYNVGIDELDEEIANNPNSPWKRYEETNKKEANATCDYCIYYYNKTTRELRWRLKDIKVNSSSTSNYINFQLVVKIVDPDVLMGVKTGKYINTLTVTQEGRFVEEDVAGQVTINRSPISKSINSEDGKGNADTIPFKIVVNDVGEDLLPNADKITLVDEMSPTMTIEIPTINVVDKNGNKVNNVTIAMERTEQKTCLKLTVPDNEELIITYTVKVNASENESVAISNIAHWDGYDPSPSTEVVISNYSYSLAGTTIVYGQANLQLTKRDAENIMTTLAGATYSMQEAQLQSDGTYQLVGNVYTATTDKNGVLNFSTDKDGQGYWMKYDTIYAIQEVTAPEDYVLDESPQYILLASKSNKTTYPSEVAVQYNSSQYLLDATDEPVPAYVIPSAGGTGTLPIQATGALLLTVSAGCYGYTRWRRRHTKH
jgi:hypothetical protein